MASTTTANYASTVRTKHFLELLNTAKGYLIADKFAGHKMVGKGEGNTVRVNKLLRPAKQTSAGSAGTMVTAGSAKNLVTNYQEFSIEHWNDSFGWQDEVDVVSFIKDSDNRSTVARQMANTLDYQVMKKIATGGMRRRTDTTASTYQKSGTCTGSPTATSLISTGLTETTADFWKGGYATITNADGPNYDITSPVTGFTATGDIATVSFPQALSTSSKFHITVGTGLSDTMDTGALLEVSALHEKLETEKYGGNGGFKMFMAPEQHLDLHQDTTYLQSVVYDDSYHLGTYKMGRIFDIEFLVSSNIYREDVDGTENQASGAVFIAPIFGQNSHSVFTFANPGGSGKFGVKFLTVDTPDSQNLTNAQRFLTWKGMYAGGVTRATSIINLMTTATSLGVTV